MNIAVLDRSVLGNQASAAASVVERTGRSSPLGAAVLPDGVNFSFFPRSASGVNLLFFDREDDVRPSRVIPFDPATNHTYRYWHVFVPGVQPGQLYAYRVAGPPDPANGLICVETSNVSDCALDPPSGHQHKMKGIVRVTDF